MTQCPTCDGRKDRRAQTCHRCRMRARPARLGTGRHGIGKSVNADGYVTLNEAKQYEHRAVMERALGRKLKPDEHVHHVNGVKNDNRLENLQLLSASEHHREHIRDRVKAMSVLGHQARWGG